MNRAVFFKTLMDSRRSIIGWTLGVAVYSLLIASTFSSFANDENIQELTDSYPESITVFFEGIEDYGQPENYLNVQLFSIMPLAIGIFAIMHGLSNIGGEERAQTLDTLVTLPIPRRVIITEKFMATAVILLCILTGYFIALLASTLMFAEIDLNIFYLAIASYGMFFPLICIAGVAYLASAALPASRRWGGGIAAAFMVASYLIYNLGNATDILKPLQIISVFNYYNSLEILSDGPAILDFIVLSIAAAGLYVASVFAFERRDLGV